MDHATCSFKDEFATFPLVLCLSWWFVAKGNRIIYYFALAAPGFNINASMKITLSLSMTLFYLIAQPTFEASNYRSFNCIAFCYYRGSACNYSPAKAMICELIHM